MEWKITRIEETGSTNADLAMMKDAPEGTVLEARSQMAGRGRQGRTWISQADAGLYFSVLLRPCVPPCQAATLSLLAGVAVASALEALLHDEGTDPSIKIKWPNDILAHGRKICGILCEMTGGDATAGVIIGIGINVNLNSATLPKDVANKATSLKEIAGRNFDKEYVLASVLKSLSDQYAKWRSEGLAAARPFLDSHDYLRGKRVDMSLLGEPLAGKALGIATNGALLLQLDNGSIQEVFSGEAHIQTDSAG